MRPRARRDDVVIRELPGELIVYDRRDHRAHCLNATAARVFREADGSRSIVELAAGLDAGVASDVGEALVREALEQLAEAGLLAAAQDDDALDSRRELLRRLGGAAALLVPAIVSVLAPTPADAASCLTSCPPSAESQPCQCLIVPQPDCGTCQIDGTCTGALGGPC